MNEQEAKDILEQLRNGTQQKVLISKDDFMCFRAQLVLQKDREAFVGTADKGGSVTYVYTPQPEEGQSH
ncbi:hypothetical protein [Alkalihalobacterium elongatum]|uniref:hypothetical protein n=1 Tax=Alkalihalobacterium elongatum TaxID=2675466 RepID=UPI001C1F7701|nr:hypothetical protein [Alkalihalobacterium elongatum]